MSNSSEVLSLILTAAAVFVAAYEVLQIAFLPRADTADVTNQNRERICLLRRRSMLYRFFEPILVDLSSNKFVQRIVHFETIRSFISSGASSLPYQPQELASIVFLRSLIAALLAAILGTFAFSLPVGLLIGAILVFAYATIHAQRCKTAMNNRLASIVKRLPHATDILAMQLTAGTSFRQAFSLITGELEGHALGEEFARVSRDAEHGMSMGIALESLAQRLPHSDVKDFVVAIRASQKRGTPLAKTLGNLANQMRVRRTERGEKAAGKAQANITFPGLVIMGACLLILLAPFVLQLIEENPFDF